MNRQIMKMIIMRKKIMTKIIKNKKFNKKG